MAKLTQHQKIVTLMCKYPNRWFYPYDFMDMGLGELFVGYEASARLSELTKEHPYLFSIKTEGKYNVRRIDTVNISTWFTMLPKDLRQIVAKELDYYPYGPSEN